MEADLGVDDIGDCSGWLGGHFKGSGVGEGRSHGIGGREVFMSSYEMEEDVWS